MEIENIPEHLLSNEKGDEYAEWERSINDFIAVQDSYADRATAEWVKSNP